MKEGFLDNKVARGVLRVTDEKRGMKMEQVVFTRRPWWSKVGADLFALPGGKIEYQDFQRLVERGILTQEKLDDPEWIPDEGRIKLAAIEAIRREFLEELGAEAAAMVAVGLIYIGLDETWDEKNQITWLSYSFAKDGDHKPAVETQPNSDGTAWENVPRIMIGASSLDMLEGQQEMAAFGVSALAVKKAS